MSDEPEQSPWARPPFWAAGPSVHDLDRAYLRELQRKRSRLSFLDVGTDAWQKVYRRIRELEGLLKLQPTINGVGMPRG